MTEIVFNAESATTQVPASQSQSNVFRRRSSRKRIVVLGVLAALFGLSVSGCSGNNDTGSSISVDDSVEEDQTTETVTEEEYPNETAAQKNARESAESYLAFSAFSREGLIGQLEFEEYETADAEYAVDILNIDWNEQAAKSALSYLDTSAFSRSGLIGQLEYEGFTTEQATFGVDASGADWNEQAAKSAESYLRTMSFSRAQLIDQLIFEGFTKAQATFGVDAAGL